MDDFGLDRAELTGSLISMEFGAGGRIQQLWVADPNLRDEGEEFQFVLPPLSLGEEISEDYNPGTILLGARTNPDEPWILSRNTRAEPMDDVDDPLAISFRYSFGLLPEIHATGRYYEVAGEIPELVWDLRLTNRGRVTIEIGELGFPLALNNLYEGYPRTDRGLEAMYRDRIAIHPFIGGAASYVFAQRLTAEPPGLLITPGDNTSWEFFHHVPASLATPYRWEGIPIVYAHSRAAVEREGWGEWFNEHSSRVLEPGDSLSAQMRFYAAVRDRFDGVHQTLVMARRPALRIFPAAVAPAGVGIAMEVSGATPTRFFSDREADTETDSDQEGGFCYVRPHEPGPFALSFEDTEGRVSTTHLLFTEPIETLMQRRASFIVEKQLLHQPDSNLDGAFVPTRIDTGTRLTAPEDYALPFGVESILSEALFLAEKNLIHPVRSEIAALEEFVDTFLRQSLQNPSNGAVGSAFVDSLSTAVHFGRPQVYPMVAVLYHTLSKIARDAGTIAHDRGYYLCQAAVTAKAMAENADPEAWRATGIPLMSAMHEALAEAKHEGILDENYSGPRRGDDIARRRFPFAGIGTLYDTTGFEEAHWAAMRASNFGLQERAMSAAFAARSLAPCWWWYGSDKRFLDDNDGLTHPALLDKGEMCLGPTSAGNGQLFLRTLSRDTLMVSDTLLRLTLGGLMGVWALVREDGAVAHGFCPDPASRHYGMSWATGTGSLGLYHYLRVASTLVLPSPQGAVAFGCHFEAREKSDGMQVTLQPWEGVGRRVLVRQIGLEVEARVGKIEEFKFHSRKRHATVTLSNPADFERRGSVAIRGLWGSRFEVNGRKEHAANGVLSIEEPLPAGGKVAIEVKVIG